MANPDGELTVAQRLGRALDRGLLPAGGPAEAAERLIERLERPARIALLGLPGSGKSSILNLLVGAIVVPETLRLPTIIVQHGTTARMICTLTDGSTKILPGSDLADVLPLAPALVTLEMDLAALKVISLLEVSAGPMEAEQKRAATWASKRADIVIWCTTSYLPKEQVVWESLPDAVKDNSFMFLTKVDLLGSRQSASAMHERVELRAGEEFRQILSISAKQAREAVPPGGPVNRDLFRDSGASGVITAIKTRVQSGRRADMDTAELLLARHVEASELVARRFAEPGEETEAPQAWVPPPEPEEVAAAPEPVEEAEPELEEDEAEADDRETLEDDFEDDADADAEDALEEESEEEDGPEEADDIVEPEEEVAELEADIVEAAAPEPVATAVPEPADPPPTRKRFADRIKRVASDGEAGSAPMVPLRSTWKSKAELDAVPEPAPEPPKAPEPTRRPRSVAPPPQDSDDVSRMLSSISAAPDQPTTPPEPRERTPRAMPARPEPAAEAPRTVRPGLFGGRRTAESDKAADNSLPDLSSLRARPEELTEANEAEETDAEEVEAEVDRAHGEAEPAEVSDLEPDLEPEAEPEPEPEPEPEIPAPAPVVAPPVERPRLFGRDPRPRPAEAAPSRPEPPPRATPPERIPASARLPSQTSASAPKPAPTAATADDEQFTPRAIMMRDRRTEPDAPSPRRERPRIAARAVPVSEAPVAPAPTFGVEHDLADEAVGLILARSAELEREIDPEDKVPVDLILEHARETGEQVMAVVSRGRSDEMRRINNDVGELLDLIMLMQLEKGHAPADDALTLILQLRRELETLRAV